MRNPDRIPRILSKVEEIWTQYPDLRLGQLIFLILTTGTEKPVINVGDSLFNVDDSELFMRIQAFKEGIQ